MTYEYIRPAEIRLHEGALCLCIGKGGARSPYIQDAGIPIREVLGLRPFLKKTPLLYP